jgi:hypothetical protein
MSLTLNAQIDKMEPPFGMQVCKIQNCKYYFTEDIAQNKVSVSNGIKITNITKTENQLYFVTIDTKSDCI